MLRLTIRSLGLDLGGRLGDVLLLGRGALLLVPLVRLLHSLAVLVLAVEGLGVVGHLLVHHVGRHLAVTHLVETVRLGRLRSEVLVGVEATQSHDVGQIRDADHGHGVLHGVVELWALRRVLLLGSVVRVSCCFLLLVVFEFFRHWWQRDALWQVGQWVDQLSLFLVGVVERAAVAKLALSDLNEVLAGHSLVVGVHCSEGCFSEVGWKGLFKND